MDPLGTATTPVYTDGSCAVIPPVTYSGYEDCDTCYTTNETTGDLTVHKREYTSTTIREMKYFYFDANSFANLQTVNDLKPKIERIVETVDASPFVEFYEY